MATLLLRRRATHLTSSGPLAGYIAWWDATKITGVTSGSQFSIWHDQSANAYDFTQGTGTFQPTWNNSGAHTINSLGTVYFNGSNTVSVFDMGSQPITQAQPFTFLLVFRTDSPTANQTLIQNGSSFNIGMSGSVYTSGGTLELSGGTTDSSAHLIAVVANGASSSILIDNASVASGNAGTPALSGNVWIGGNVNSTSHPFTGAVGEALIYPSALNASQLAALHTYAKNKWGTP